MSFVPSIRECLHQLDRLRDTPQLVANLKEFAAELEVDMHLDALTEALARLVVLHQLCLHMAANMSGGAGIPPTPSTKKVLPAPAPAPAHSWKRTPMTSPPPAPKPAPAPKPPAMPAPPRAVAKPPAIDPLTVYSTEQAADRLRISTHHIKSMHTDGKLPRPVAGGRGVPLLWARVDIDRVATEREANPPRRGRPRLSGYSAHSTNKGST